MNGGFVHDQLALARLEATARSIGATTHRQVRTVNGRYLDLLIELPQLRIGIEVELTTRRIGNDLEKAMDLRLDQIWIVVPDVRVAHSVRNALDRLEIPRRKKGIFVLTLGLAKARLTNCFSLFSGSMTPPENKKQITNNPQNRKGPRP